MDEILSFTTKVTSISHCIQLHNITMGGFHGNFIYDTILDFELPIPLNDYKSPMVPQT